MSQEFPRTKRWWGAEIKEARRTYSHARREWKGQEISTTELRQVRNSYYRAIRRAKRICWKTFLEGATDQPSLGDTAKCWQAHLMPRRELVSRTPKTAAEVALFGRLLTVTPVNGVYYFS